jgi:hypothetical protein
MSAKGTREFDSADEVFATYVPSYKRPSRERVLDEVIASSSALGSNLAASLLANLRSRVLPTQTSQGNTGKSNR